jgi:superfamily II DNA or RNA helicase
MTQKMELLTRPCQKRAHERTTELLETHDKCIVKMFCGTGKSRVIRAIILTQKKPLNIVVFPSLALIRQFTADYLKDKEVTKTCAILNVSSEQLDDFQSTTEPADIQKFTVAKPKGAKGMKIVCVTYQSLQVLLDNLGDAMIGLACFDEAHRTTSPEYSKLVYSDEYRAKYEKQVFFTATPANQNGITMFDRERDEMGTYGDCGPLASEYTYLQGLRDAILSLFELRVDLYTQDTLGNMYESIARAILTTGNTRVLTFHADAAEDSKSETSVLRFVDKAKFMESFHSVCAKEFPDKVGKFAASNVTFTAITAETKNKDAILGAFETCSDDEIYIVSSCRTIGEGVDTKKANMCVFVDPKSSVISIIQNIGRICRKVEGVERQPATVLIPVCIGWEKYVAAGDDAETQDKLIREQLNDRENGDYNAIMNVCAALKQEDPELYELCLRYPSNFTESERKHALESQKKRNDPDDYVYGEEIDELVEDGERVEIHTSNVDVPIVYRGFDEEDDDEDERPIQRFYEVDEENEDGEMETRYHRIVPTQEDEEEDEDSNRRLNPPKATNRPRMNIHTNDEIKLIWKIGDVALGEQFGSGVLECQVERLDNDEIWMENHQQMCVFIDENGRVPNAKKTEEKKLSSWISNQKSNYDLRGSVFSKHGIKTQERWQIWTETLEKYKKYLVIDYVQDWKDNHKKMCEFIDANNKIPSQHTHDTDEKRLGSWVSCQKCKYDPHGPPLSKCGMKNIEIWQIWTDTLQKYNKYLVIDYVQNWKDNHKKMCEFIDKNGKRPQCSRAKVDPHEKKLGCWVSNQKTNHDLRGSEYSKYMMKITEIWQIWTETIEDFRYNKHLIVDDVQVWKENHQQMCEFIDENGRAPSQKAKANYENEKKLARWIGTQKRTYDENGPEFSRCIMKTNPEIWTVWTKTLADPKYNGFIKRKFHIVKSSEDPVQHWNITLSRVCEFIDTNKKTPSHSSADENEKILARWIGTQKRTYDENGPEFSICIMKTNPEIWKIWNDTLNHTKYKEHLVVNRIESWKIKHTEMCNYITQTGKLPCCSSKDPNTKKIAQWVSDQKKFYNPEGSEQSVGIMKIPEIWQIWTDTIADPKYIALNRKIVERTSKCPVQHWKNMFESVCSYIEKNKRAPPHSSKCTTEKNMEGWIHRQKESFDSNGSEFSNNIMKNEPEVWKLWSDALSNPKYKDTLTSKTINELHDIWKTNLLEVCKFIDSNNKAPSNSAEKGTNELTLAYWIGTQKSKYDPRGVEFSKKGMKNPEKWQIWTDTLADPKYHASLNVKRRSKTSPSISPSPSPSSPPTKSKPKVVSKKSHLMPNPTAESLECSAPKTNSTSLKRVITDSEYKLTGRAWARQKSSTTHEKLQANPAEWHAYHAARDISFKGYVDQSQIPRNRVIAHLANKRKHRLRILDLGCGRNNIAQHYANADKNHKFAIQGYDHVAEEGSGALAGNIADLAAQEEDESADICIYSQSLMGSDWRDYLTEGHRMLRYNGEFIISEHIKMLDDVRAELGRLGCKVESVDADASATDASATDANASDDEVKDKVAKWFVLIARKV